MCRSTLVMLVIISENFFQSYLIRIAFYQWFLKSCEHKVSYVLTDLLDICVIESYFPEFLGLSSVAAEFMNVRKSLWLKTTVK